VAGTFGLTMSIDLRLLQDMRRDVLREMPDRVTISRQDGFVLDAITLTQVPLTTDVAVAVEASVVRRTTKMVQQGEGGFDDETYHVHIPHTVEGVVTGDRVTVDACTDPDAVGRLLTVQSVTFGTFGASRRLVCVELEPGLHQITPEAGS